MEWLTDHAGVWFYWLSALVLFIFGIRLIGRYWDDMKARAAQQASYRQMFSRESYVKQDEYRWRIFWMILGSVLLCAGLSCGWPGTLILAFFVWQFHSGLKRQRKQKQRAKEAAELEVKLAEEQRKNQAIVQGVMTELGWDDPTFIRKGVTKNQ